MKSFIVTIEAKNRITLPHEVLEHLGVVGGGTVYTKKVPDGSLLLSKEKLARPKAVPAPVRRRKRKGSSAV